MDHKVANGVLTLYLVGKLNSGNAEQTEQEIDRIMANNKFDAVVFDLENLEYISSAGLRIILRIKQEYDDTKIINVSSGVYDIFDMVGFTSFLTIEKK